MGGRVNIVVVDESKEATHQRFYTAFHDWFVSTPVDFWDEYDAPEALATIAVEIADALAISAIKQAEAEARRQREIELQDQGWCGICLGYHRTEPRECCAARIAREARTKAIEETITFIEGGRFLHDTSPPKRFAGECVAGLRRHFAIARPPG